MSTMNIFDMTDTWNVGATTFTAIKMNATDTASAAGSLLIDLQVGGVSQFKATKTGVVTVGATLELGNASDTTLSRVSGGVVAIEGNTIFTSNNLPGTTINWLAIQNFAAQVSLSQETPILVINRTTSTADNRRWDFVDYNEALRFRAVNDADSAASDWCVVDRTGTTVDQIAWNATTLDFNGTVDVSAQNIVPDTSTGTKIGTATNQKISFFNQTPVVQPTAVADATTAVDVITQFNALLTRMRNLGLIAT